MSTFDRRGGAARQRKIGGGRGVRCGERTRRSRRRPWAPRPRVQRRRIARRARAIRLKGSGKRRRAQALPPPGVRRRADPRRACRGVERLARARRPGGARRLQRPLEHGAQFPERPAVREADIREQRRRQLARRRGSAARGRSRSSGVGAVAAARGTGREDLGHIFDVSSRAGPSGGRPSGGRSAPLSRRSDRTARPEAASRFMSAGRLAAGATVKRFGASASAVNPRHLGTALPGTFASNDVGPNAIRLLAAGKRRRLRAAGSDRSRRPSRSPSAAQAAWPRPVPESGAGAAARAGAAHGAWASGVSAAAARPGVVSWVDAPAARRGPYVRLTPGHTRLRAQPRRASRVSERAGRPT